MICTEVCDAFGNHDIPFLTSNQTADDVNDDRDPVEFFADAVLASFFIVIGVIGNVLSILVWKQKKMRSPTGVYLMFQAGAGISLLLFYLLTDTLQAVVPGVRGLYGYGVFYSYVGYPVLYLCQVLNVWITVGVTVDRFILISCFSRAKVTRP